MGRKTDSGSLWQRTYLLSSAGSRWTDGTSDAAMRQHKHRFSQAPPPAHIVLLQKEGAGNKGEERGMPEDE